MVTYGCKRCKDEYDLPKRDSEWFTYLLQKETGLYKHSDKERERYNLLIDRQTVGYNQHLKRSRRFPFLQCTFKQ